MLEYAGSKKPSMQLKFGSCFADRLSIRPYDNHHYGPKYFDREGIVKGDMFGITMDTDIIGLKSGHDINVRRVEGKSGKVRRVEGKSGKASFPRRPGDEVFTVNSL